MASMEEDFPRGGSNKTSTEPQTVKPRVEVDNLFEDREPPKKKEKTSKPKNVKAAKDEQKTEGDSTLKLNKPTDVDILQLKNLNLGTTVLGSVKEVTDFEVVLNLPSGLKGFLPIAGISDAYNEILKQSLDSDQDLENVSSSKLLIPGQLVRCVVLSLGKTGQGFASIKLSVNPKEVNKELSSSSLKAGMTLSGCVESVEDHGYLIDIGVTGTKAFLPKDNVNDTKSSKQDLNIGQYMTVLVTEVKNGGRVVRVSADSTAVCQACAGPQHGWTLSNLLPGLLVTAHIKKVTLHGLVVTFLSSFTGVVDFLHMDPDKAPKYSIGDEVKARILYIEPSTRHVSLSLLKNLLPPETDVLDTVSSVSIGTVVEGCKMTAFHHNSGAVMELPDGAFAFIHKNHLKESHEEYNPNKLLAETQHTLRILDYSPLEGMHIATLRKSIIKQTFFSYNDITVGQLIECTVFSVEKPGIAVKISDHIRAMIPRHHMADVTLTNPEKKFIVGTKIQCRVLSVDVQNKKILLTKKKSLIESQLPVLASYSDARVGLVSHGIIFSMRDFGCILRFYNDVKGVVLMQEMTTDFTENPQSLFYVGQVVKAKVLSCNPENKKMALSFKAVNQDDVEVVQTAEFDFEVGKKVEAVVRKKDLSGLYVSILPEEVPAHLPTIHLSDHTTNWALLLDGLQDGDLISNVVCLNKTKQGITLTKKPMLLAALSKDQVNSFSELQVGMTMVGWVKAIMSYGVFVMFPNNLFGLAPLSALTDKFILSTEGLFQVGQTVLAKVTNLDEEKRRFLVSLKESEVSFSKEDAQARFIQGQGERRAAYEMKATRDVLLTELHTLSLGDKLKLTVGETAEDGSVSLTTHCFQNAKVLASAHHATGVNTTPGCKVTAVVLHVDLVTSRVHVSLLPKLAVKKKSLEKGSQHPAIVQYVDKDFATISLGDTGRLTVIPKTTHLNKVFFTESEKLTVGSKLTVTVIEPECKELGNQAFVVVGVPSQLAKATRERAPSVSLTPQHGYNVGDMVTAKVRTIKPTHVLVDVDGISGSIQVTEIQESPKVGSFPTSSLKVGTEVKARVIGGREVKGHNFLPFSHPNFVFSLPELSLLPSKLDANVRVIKTGTKLKDYKPGDEITCFVSKYSEKNSCLELFVAPGIIGTAELLTIISKPGNAKHPQKLFKAGQCVIAKVVNVITKKRNGLFLSLTGRYKLEPGAVVMGSVLKINPQKGLVLKLPFGKLGFAFKTDLSDEYTENPVENYNEDQVVRCCVLGQKDGKFHVSLRRSRINARKSLPVQDVEITSISDLKEGQIVRGYVHNVGEKGIFVSLSRSIIGRALFKHTTNYYVDDNKKFAEYISPNALLTAKIIHVDTENSHVGLSLLPEDTGKADVLPESLGLPWRQKKMQREQFGKTFEQRKRKLTESKQEEAGEKKKKCQADDRDSGVEVYFREEETPKGNKRGRKEANEKDRLQVTSTFSWDTELNSLKPATAAENVYESSDDEQDSQSKPAKRSRWELAQERKEAEQNLSRLETELMDPSARPESSSAFERLLLSSPDSSLLWLQYMAFHLQATQIDQARAVAERAIKTISFREEQEKLNVWVALLNLENMYGTEESLQKVFERAVQYCEPLPVYQQLADIYVKSNKIKKAESLYKNMIKRFRDEKAVWQSYGSFLLRQGQSDAANLLLQRALQSFSNKDHVDLITKFARLEFQYGSKDKGKAMFDRVLSGYPKRTDLWSVFIDLMVKHGSQKEIRDLFDRVIHLSASVKKIKFFFKRYLDYEKQHGTPESIKAVKQKALEYVEAKGTEAS